ncbi:carbon monoxide dehydrogenase subunit G [Thermocatellispora tengchongensis]|uniref:Carbon monoxide dehydrogenase subunit G n=1 Tax=Thermocatellispora tengchongensis TaxID=1073253 RepID=A0A840PNG5_9ACTN|nr:SRPBCC family protein [Thermocatellispora tengchongensis]MBB5139321.1 carbon monoxide dehydrogenase subunit G [Thermocatellispora tengchongensis]
MAMRFEHEFSVPVPVEQAWTTLLDVERVAPCLPGASVESVEGDDITGTMKVKVGPINVTYRGTAVFEDIDKDARTVTLKASGKETKGTGTAGATVHARLEPREDTTLVRVETTFNVTGRPAQFGRGVMAEVGAKLIDRFAENLSTLLTGGETAGEQEQEPRPAETAGIAPAAPEPSRAADEPRHLSAVPEIPRDPHPVGTARTSRTPQEEALDLLEIAGTPLLKRLAPVAGAVVLLVAAIWLLRRLLRTR